jgi:hypothetical protein
MNAQGKYIDGITELAMVGEFVFTTGLIDPKMDLANIRLAVRHTPMVVNPKMKSSALFGIVATDQITEGIACVLVNMGPQGDGKWFLTQLDAACFFEPSDGRSSIEKGSLAIAPQGPMSDELSVDALSKQRHDH